MDDDILGWRASCHRKMSSKGYPLNAHLSALVLDGGLARLSQFKEAVQLLNVNEAGTSFPLFSETVSVCLPGKGTGAFQ